MCLDKVTGKNPFKPTEEVVAWGVFKKTDQGLYGLYFGGPYEEGEWYHKTKDRFGRKVSSPRLLGHAGTLYSNGFHKFATEKAAHQYMKYSATHVRKVLLKQVHTVGVQFASGRLYKTYVANKMKILPE